MRICRAVAFPFATVVLGCFIMGSSSEALSLDENPARPGEWGFRPFDGKDSVMNPPGFVWRPQKNAASYDLEVARDAKFANVAYRIEGLKYNCHCPSKTFEQGTWHWRFRMVNKKGERSDWSKVRSFTIGPDAIAFPMPAREELLGRIPKQHPRLFVRPEQISELRKHAQGDLKPVFDALVKQCEKIMKNPPPTEEPPKYPKGMKRGSDPWRKIWWGNRRYTTHVLNGAATLAFTRLLGGKEEYGQMARRLLLAAAEWDPKGSTGYRYNDEAGMPYNYFFSRTYTFVNDLLTDEEKAKCREVMTVRGREMYRHLCPRHLWRPYASHSNRAWHFLGEIGVAFKDEIPEADEWVWFAMNVFYNMYPVWCDDDGGWHEGSCYWSSYIGRFTWWADVMRVAMGIDAYKKPYFSKVGYYPMYLQPPGTQGGGFGDLTAWRTSSHNRKLMTVFAAQARNPYWQWYVDEHGGPQQESGYIGFIRGALPTVQAKAPVDLPSSRVFRGTGQAMLNTNIMDAKHNVEIIFKSSPFGSQSHGYESQNAFLLYVFGERLLIRTGRRDSYGSKHHKEWMWHTKSVNSITVNGESQKKHSQEPLGEITAFHTSDAFDFVQGDASTAYGDLVKRFTRSILFVKPELIVIYDRLETPKPSSFEWRLHAPTKMKVNGQEDIRVVNNKSACRVSFLAPKNLKLSLTDKFDTPPRPRIKLVEWHLTATPPEPMKQVEFVTLIRPHRVDDTPPANAALHRIDGGYALEADLKAGRVIALMRAGEGELKFGDVSTDAELAAVKLGQEGQPSASFSVDGGAIRFKGERLLNVSRP
ncbi:MAG: DUF4962 domain-containing protein [Planctomycetes bacterium]|nr:DUF4962 domain-containing protein [Planctomycetota bacterium]